MGCSRAVSRVSQFNCSTTEGTVKALRVVTGYLKVSTDFKLGGARLLSVDDHFGVFTANDHHGDKMMTPARQTGVMVLLSGISIHWGASKQSTTDDRHACAEIFHPIGIKRSLGGDEGHF